MAEVRRIGELLVIENELYNEGYRLIAGVDEAGRGPLAGPVMAAACILPRQFDLPGLDDSKKIAEKKRVLLAAQIKEQAMSFSIGSATSKEIDLLNILKATKIAMKRALDNLSCKPEFVLIDGREGLDMQLSHRTVIGGDGLSASIAAASILAKVARDELMFEMHQIYPEYGFDQHKGYCTRLHLQILEKYGPCPIHRRSFSPVKELISVPAIYTG